MGERHGNPLALELFRQGDHAFTEGGGQDWELTMRFILFLLQMHTSGLWVQAIGPDVLPLLQVTVVAVGCCNTMRAQDRDRYPTS